LFELLVRKYLDKGNFKEVNYLEFGKDVDKPEDMFPGYKPKRPVAEATVSIEKKPISTFFKETT